MSTHILPLLAEATAAATGDEFFRSLAQHAARALGARYAFVAETLSEFESRSLAYWEGSGFGEGFSYRFPGTPCQRVAQGFVCVTSTRLQELFPEDLWLQQIGAHSYLGVPMKTADGRVLGHIAVLHTEPMEPDAEHISALQIIAQRGCAELQRKRAEHALQEALSEVERLKEQLRAENIYLREEIRSDHNFDELIGNSPAWQRLLKEIDSVSTSDATVLIHGETGTGKELIARALHSRSPRRERALVKVNCGAISAGLVESELFGHVKGAFTGAVSNRVGRFQLADGGTLFLDEVGELPLDTQVKLLRVLQEREFEAVGSSRPSKVDVRVIAATNRDLARAIRSRTFRADLYYRLNVIPLFVPPLRERRADIPELALYFMERSARKLGKSLRGIATATLDRMLQYDWPGNVRELQNIIERAVILASGPALTLDPELLKSAIMLDEVGPRAAAAAAPDTPSPAATTRSAQGIRPLDPAHTADASRSPEAAAAPASAAEDLLSLEQVERRHILAVLERTGWIIEGTRGAAEMLALNPSTTRSRMKKLGITRPR